MNSNKNLNVTAAALFAVAAFSFNAATTSAYADASPVQSSVRPLGLDIVDKVQIAASDDSAKKFQTEVLPSVTKLVNEKLVVWQKRVARQLRTRCPYRNKLAMEKCSQVGEEPLQKCPVGPALSCRVQSATACANSNAHPVA